MTMGKQIFYHNLKNNSIPELENYIQILKEKHHNIDKKIKDGFSHYLDDDQLQKMKFEKAAIKREIAEYEQRLKDVKDEA